MFQVYIEAYFFKTRNQIAAFTNDTRMPPTKYVFALTPISRSP